MYTAISVRFKRKLFYLTSSCRHLRIPKKKSVWGKNRREERASPRAVGRRKEAELCGSPDQRKHGFPTGPGEVLCSVQVTSEAIPVLQ